MTNDISLKKYFVTDNMKDDIWHIVSYLKAASYTDVTRNISLACSFMQINYIDT